MIEDQVTADALNRTTYTLVQTGVEWRLVVTTDGSIENIIEGEQRWVLNELLRLTAPTLTTALRRRKIDGTTNS